MNDSDLIEAVRSRAHDPALATDEGHDIKDALGRPVLYVANDRASTDRIIRLEEVLGCKLPPLMRRLYTEIGDGGFGPGYGLLGLGTLEKEYRLLGKVHSWWPRSVLPIATWGCGVHSCIDTDSPTAVVLRYDPDIEEEQTRELLGQRYIAPNLLPEAESINEWLQAWLDGATLFDMPLSGIVGEAS